LTGLTGSREGLKEDYFCLGRTPKQKVCIHYYWAETFAVRQNQFNQPMALFDLFHCAAIDNLLPCHPGRAKLIL
jgi:hypothetical protein